TLAVALAIALVVTLVVVATVTTLLAAATAVAGIALLVAPTVGGLATLRFGFGVFGRLLVALENTCQEREEAFPQAGFGDRFRRRRGGVRGHQLDRCFLA